LRSRTQGELLAELLGNPEREWTISDLSRHLDIPLTTAQSEVARLESAGLLTSRKVGRSRLVKPDLENPMIPPLSQLVLMAFGPRQVISEEFADVPATKIVIFGSWAARLCGEQGPLPRDIDVLVVTDQVDRDAMYAAAERSEAKLGRPVNPLVRSIHAWNNPAGDALLAEISRRPRIDVTAGDGIEVFA
jgi:DNA-binding transcriptional ArsR family regulator